MCNSCPRCALWSGISRTWGRAASHTLTCFAEGLNQPDVLASFFVQWEEVEPCCWSLYLSLLLTVRRATTVGGNICRGVTNLTERSDCPTNGAVNNHFMIPSPDLAAGYSQLASPSLYQSHKLLLVWFMVTLLSIWLEICALAVGKWKITPP